MPFWTLCSPSNVVLALSILFAFGEAWFAWRNRRHSDKLERVHSGLAISFGFFVALLTWFDGNRIDGYIDQLRKSIATQGATIDGQDKRLALQTTRLKKDEGLLAAEVLAGKDAQGRISDAEAQLKLVRNRAQALTASSNATGTQVAKTRADVNTVRNSVTSLSADTTQQLNAIRRDTKAIAAKAGLYHLDSTTRDDLVELLTKYGHGRGSVACTPGSESVCGDFGFVFKTANWDVLVQRGVALFSGPALIDQHAIFVWYRIGTRPIAESFAARLRKAGLDAVTRDDSQDHNAPDIGITVKYTQA